MNIVYKEGNHQVVVYDQQWSMYVSDNFYGDNDFQEEVEKEKLWDH